MKIIGITGGVGAGKSTILDYLSRKHNAYVIQADKDSVMNRSLHYLADK